MNLLKTTQEKNTSSQEFYDEYSERTVGEDELINTYPCLAEISSKTKAAVIPVSSAREPFGDILGLIPITQL